MVQRFVLFITHDYMDRYPSNEVRVIKGETLEEVEKNAKGYADHMNKVYSGGTTTFKEVFDMDKAIQYLNKNIGMDWDNDANIAKLFEQCYMKICK